MPMRPILDAAHEDLSTQRRRRETSIGATGEAGAAADCGPGSPWGAGHQRSRAAARPRLPIGVARSRS